MSITCKDNFIISLYMRTSQHGKDCTTTKIYSFIKNKFGNISSIRNITPDFSSGMVQSFKWLSFFISFHASKMGTSFFLFYPRKIKKNYLSMLMICCLLRVIRLCLNIWSIYWAQSLNFRFRLCALLLGKWS